jgi:hypothetical protein
MNYWKQLNHVLKYFADEEGINTKLPHSFMGGFLEVNSSSNPFFFIETDHT